MSIAGEAAIISICMLICHPTFINTVGGQEKKYLLIENLLITHCLQFSPLDIAVYVIIR